MRNKLTLLGLVFFMSIPVFAQETKTEDPYADYSYLWEKPKKTKKKKSKKKNPTKTVAKDSLQLNDSTRTQKQLPSDTTQTQVPSDTTQTESVEQELDTIDPDKVLQDSLKQAKKAEKRAQQKDKMEGKPPSSDFRSGLPPLNASSSLNGGLTYTRIDGKDYVGMVLAPELTFGKVGVGLDVPILYGLDDKSFRTEMFKDGVGALRLIRYVRYGQQKVDPVYIKVGTLSGTMIGYGGLVNNYTNSTSYEKRKIGLHYDFNVKGFAGMEGMYSDFDFSSFNLFVMRPYVRPLSKMGIPIVSSLEIGATFVRDKDQTKLAGSTDDNPMRYALTKDGVGAFGIDAGLTLLRIPFIQIDAFINWSRLDMNSQALQDLITATDPTASYSDGSGFSAGVNFRMNFIADVMKTDIRIERLSYTDHYLPQFFDASYEIGKDAKIYSLVNATKMKGIYGSLTGHVLQKMQLGGTLLLPDDVSETNPATVGVFATVNKLANKFSLDARYIKGGLTDLGDAFKLDERSLAKVRFTYHINKWMVMGTDYFWAFTPVEGGGVKSTKYVSPFVGVSVQF